MSPQAASRAAYGNPYLLLILTTAMWGGNAVAGRLAVGEVSPFLLTGLRWVVAAVTLAVLMRRPLAEGIAVLIRHWKAVLAMAAFGYTAFNGLFYVAARYTTGVNLTLLQGSIPIFVLIGGAIVYRTRVRPLQVLGIVTTMLGVVVTATHGDLTRLSALAFNHGDLLILAACFLYAGYTLSLRARPRVPGLVFFCALAIAALATSLPLVAFEWAAGDLRWPSLQGWLVVLYVGLFPSLISQIFFMRGVELIGPDRAGIFVNLVPIFGALFSVLILGEPFGLYHAVALALVLGGIWLAERRVPTPAA